MRMESYLIPIVITILMLMFLVTFISLFILIKLIKNKNDILESNYYLKSLDNTSKVYDALDRIIFEEYNYYKLLKLENNIFITDEQSDLMVKEITVNVMLKLSTDLYSAITSIINEKIIQQEITTRVSILVIGHVIDINSNIYSN